MNKRLMNVRELSEYISMPIASIYTYVHTHKIPDNCIKRMGRALRFDVGQVDTWINAISAEKASFQESK